MLTGEFQAEQARAAALRHADEQAHRWYAALQGKKVAMENMLRAQQSLEAIETSIATFLPKNTIEGTHARFLSTLPPSDPEALYLLGLGRGFIRPLSSRIKLAQQGVRNSHTITSGHNALLNRRG